VEPQVHEFIMQGLDVVYLTYIPRFHKANVRQQLILHVEIPDSMEAEYKKARQANPDAVFILSTAELTTIDNILKANSFKASI
jgi:3-keto-L-gulonate-6-phosphate decarboxylase